MRKILMNELGTIRFSKCKTDGAYQKCAYCGAVIGKGNIGLSLVKICTTRLNVWIHLGCIEQFSKEIIEFKNNNIKELLMEKLDDGEN